MIVDKNSCIESIEIQHEFVYKISMNDSITCYIVCAKFLVPCESAKLRVSLIFCWLFYLYRLYESLDKNVIIYIKMVFWKM